MKSKFKPGDIINRIIDLDYNYYCSKTPKGIIVKINEKYDSFVYDVYWFIEEQVDWEPECNLMKAGLNERSNT